MIDSIRVIDFAIYSIRIILIWFVVEFDVEACSVRLDFDLVAVDVSACCFCASSCDLF